ncbi:MAG: hypothetical protein ACK528_11640 [Alphaproteobacteria bacterium]
MAGQGTAWQGGARRGRDLETPHGTEWPGSAGRGKARPGKVWRGRARQGRDLKHHLAGQGATRQGEARQGFETSRGVARRGKDGPGKAGQGMDLKHDTAGRGKARLGEVGRGKARTFLHWRQNDGSEWTGTDTGNAD